jgi:hypothetical protein
MKGRECMKMPWDGKLRSYIVALSSDSCMPLAAYVVRSGSGPVRP